MLEEKSEIVKVEVVPAANTICVQWADQILKDGVVVADTPRRACYTQGMLELFLADAPAASGYAGFIDWSKPTPDPLA